MPLPLVVITAQPVTAVTACKLLFGSQDSKTNCKFCKHCRRRRGLVSLKIPADGRNIIRKNLAKEIDIMVTVIYYKCKLSVLVLQAITVV